MAKSMTTIKAVFSLLRPSSFFHHRRSISYMQRFMKADKELKDHMDKITRELGDHIEKRGAENCAEIYALIAQQHAYKREVIKFITVSSLAIWGTTVAAVYCIKKKKQNHSENEEEAEPL